MQEGEQQEGKAAMKIQGRADATLLKVEPGLTVHATRVRRPLLDKDLPLEGGVAGREVSEDSAFYRLRTDLTTHTVKNGLCLTEGRGGGMQYAGTPKG